jgi:hypothetical protein
MKKYLFEYRMNGELYGLVIEAESHIDAVQRMTVIHRNGAFYRGEIGVTIPVKLGGFTRIGVEMMKWLLSWVTTSKPER